MKSEVSTNPLLWSRKQIDIVRCRIRSSSWIRTVSRRDPLHRILRRTNSTRRIWTGDSSIQGCISYGSCRPFECQMLTNCSPTCRRPDTTVSFPCPTCRHGCLLPDCGDGQHEQHEPLCSASSCDDPDEVRRGIAERPQRFCRDCESLAFQDSHFWCLKQPCSSEGDV